MSTSGGLSDAVTLMSRVAGADVLDASLARNVTVRVAVLGFDEVLRYVTACSAAWYAASDAVPDSVSVPLADT